MYQGEDKEGAIEYLESQGYRILMNQMRLGVDGQYTRPMFDIQNDNCKEGDDDEDCSCYPWPVMPLASVTEDEAIFSFMETGLVELPQVAYDKYHEVYMRRRRERYANV